MTPQPQHGSNILGISAKSLHRAQNQGLATDAAINAKSRRFELLRHSQSLLYDATKPAGEQHRACWCHRSIRTRGDAVAVWRQDAGASARLSGVTTCGSVWHCPVCAAKVTEQRRKELDLAVTAWVKHGGSVNLLTLTFPHEADWPLADLMQRFAKALTSFKNSKGYKRIMADVGRAGSIRSLETTWGENGWHPHTHDLVFLKGEMSDADVDELSNAWARAVIKAGLASLANQEAMLNKTPVVSKGSRGCVALTIQDGKHAAEYIAKFGHDAAWGASAEMTKPHSKTGRMGEYSGEWHYTPFQLLAWSHEGDARAGALFREFAEAFTGKRMLSWSPKLRLLLTGCENDLTDEEIAAHDDPAPDESRVGAITGDQLAVLVSRNRLGDFIAYVARCCADLETAQDDIDAYVESIASLPKAMSGRYLKKPFMGRGPMQELDSVQ